MMEATTGVEPVNGGFANHCLRPLGYVAMRLPNNATLTSDQVTESV